VGISHSAEIALIEIRNPPLNALSQTIWDALEKAFKAAKDDRDVAAIVLSGAGRVFCAGADIREFDKPPDQLMRPFALSGIEKLSKPIIASLHGAALGGGLELALGCHFRIAAPGTKLGHPEVTLGLLPGAGGTQRLPRLIGMSAALEMIMSGRFVDVGMALDLGLIDAATNGESPVEAGIAYARRVLAECIPIRRTSAIVEKLRDKDAARAAIESARHNLSSAKPERLAQEKCLQAAAATLNLEFEAGLQVERELFIACMSTPEHRRLKQAFLDKRNEARR